MASLDHDVLAGHLGHLTPEQTQAFNEFKQVCIDHGVGYSSSTDNAGLKDGISDDGTLLRFLRARRFNVSAAFEQYSSSMTWRQENNLAFLYDNIDINDFDDTKNLYTHWTGRRDKDGIPVYVFEIGNLSSEKMAAYDKSCKARPLPVAESSGRSSTPTRMLRLFATYEHLIRFVMPLCSAVPNRPHPETPVTQTICIVDVGGVGLFRFWSLRSHLQDASVLATAHYPETLGRTFIVGAPSFFPTVWGWLKGWFDPITTSKIYILSPAEVLPVLSSHIDVCNIPKNYGGELDFEFGMEPLLDVEIRETLKWPVGVDESHRRLPIGPLKWVNEAEGSRTAVAVGSKDGKLRKDTVASLSRDFVQKEGINCNNEILDDNVRYQTRVDKVE